MNTKTGVSIKTDRKRTDHEYRLPPDYMTRKEHDEDVSEAAEQIKNQIPEGFSGHWDDLQGKPFGEKEELRLIYDGKTVGYDDISAITIYEGYEYLVKYKGVDYRATGERNGTGYDVHVGATFSPNDEYPFQFYYYFESDSTELEVASGETEEIELYRVYATTIPMSEKYIPLTIPRTPTAEVGQVVRVKAVDSNGVPTEWEAADLPSGGGGDTVMFYFPYDPNTISSDGGPLFIDEDCTIVATKDDLLNVKHSLILIKFTYYDYDTFSYALNFKLSLIENKEKVLIYAMDPTSGNPKLILFVAV